VPYELAANLQTTEYRLTATNKHMMGLL